MARTLQIDDVARIAAELPQVTQADRHGRRTWSVSDKTFAWERAFSKADIRRFGDEAPPAGPILAVRVEDLDAKEAWLASGLRGIFTIPHFDGFPAFLVQLRTVQKRVLRRAIAEGWRACAARERGAAEGRAATRSARKPRRASGLRRRRSLPRR